MAFVIFTNYDSDPTIPLELSSEFIEINPSNITNSLLKQKTNICIRLSGDNICKLLDKFELYGYRIIILYMEDCSVTKYSTILSNLESTYDILVTNCTKTTILFKRMNGIISHANFSFMKKIENLIE